MANLKDVARIADVSLITVSRVLNEPEKVKPDTRRRIEKIIADMDYTPNMAARNLVSGRTGVVDVYIPYSIDLSNPFVMYFIIGISEVLSETMNSFLIRRSRNKEHCCDGYIVTGLLTNEIDDFYSYAKLRNRPVALFGHTEIGEIDFIDVDNVRGAGMAVHHLIQNNHNRIGMINIDENKDHTVDRYMGFKKAMEDTENTVDPYLVIRAENSIDGGKKAAQKLLQYGGCTALFCASDILAIGAINAINEAGLSVPDDISIVGFDGLGYHLLFEPRITTIGQPVFEIGKKLAYTLLDRLNGREKRVAMLVQPELIAGKTVSLKR